jgi:hypothetical protein
MSKVRFYNGASMGYCEDCHQTVKPTSLEAEEGWTIVCPVCAARVSENATADLPGECSFTSCMGEPVAFCRQCGDATCGFHNNSGDICDVCRPVSSFTADWAGHGYEV